MKWYEKPGVAVPEELVSTIGGSQEVLKALVRRGFVELSEAQAFIDPDYYTPAPPVQLPQLDRAVDRILEALEKNELTCI